MRCKDMRCIRCIRSNDMYPRSCCSKDMYPRCCYAYKRCVLMCAVELTYNAPPHTHTCMHAVAIYGVAPDMRGVELERSFETVSNSRGLCCISQSKHGHVIAFPGSGFRVQGLGSRQYAVRISRSKHGHVIAFSRVQTLHPTPYTLHPTPYTLHPTPYTLHPTPCTLHPTPYPLHPTPCILHPTPYTLHPTPYTLNPQRQPLHAQPCPNHELS